MPEDWELEIYRLWDRLADYPAARSQRSLHLLLTTISRWIGARQAFWIGALRMHLQEHDPIGGWRPAAAQFLDYDSPAKTIYRMGMQQLEGGNINATIRHHVRNAGVFRSYTVDEIAPAEYFASEEYQQQQALRKERDRLYVIAPINSDTEAYFAFIRLDGAKFDAQSKEIATRTLRGLKWYFRQLMLQHGLLAADRPLTVTERQVLSLLMTNLSEKQIAASLGKKIDTTHHHIKSIYRKFNVNSRAALMAIWLGFSADVAELPE